MKTLVTIFALVGIISTCLVGACAAICGFKRIDRWCEKQLTDTDGQPEERDVQSKL
jgi:hypothetical protein